MAHSLPLLGAALKLADLPARAEWLKHDGRDLEIQDPCNPAFLDGDWRAAAREARTVLDGHTGRVGVHAPYDGMPWASPDQRLVTAMRERLLESLEFTATIGGTHLVLHSPFLYFGSAQTRHRGDELTDGIERTIANLAPVVAATAAQGCCLVWENIFDLRTDPIDTLVATFASPWVRRSLDTGHAHLMTARGGPPVDTWIGAAGAALAHVHLQDTDLDSDRHWAIGDGSIAWRAVFAALADLPETPRLILEVTPERQDRSVAWLSAHQLAR
jgi:sugar phosphate isomerase/epimerase